MNIEQLRQHPSFPFRDFKRNDLEFLLLEMFWIEFFKGCFGDPSQVRDWAPLFPAARTGVPVLVMANSKKMLAVRVILRINEEGRPLYPVGDPDTPDEYFLPFDLWLDDVYDSTGKMRFPGLVISTDMSESALGFARQVISDFCRSDAPQETIQTWIDRYYDSLQKYGYYWG